jgi:hypothetical protein
MVRLRVGNQSTAQIEAVVRANGGALEAFDADRSPRYSWSLRGRRLRGHCGSLATWSILNGVGANGSGRCACPIEICTVGRSTPAHPGG